MPTYFTTAQVVAAGNALDSFTPFLRDKFFGSTITFETQEILFDKVGRRRKIAPFVAPTIPGKERAKRGGKTTSYTAPYIKLKNSLTAADSQPRRLGEAYGGEGTQLTRHEELKLVTLADHENEIRGREELMCAQALISGVVTAEGDGISDTIDYGRDAALTKALTLTARWGESAKPYDDLKAWARLIASKSGAAARDVVLGYGAWDLLQKDTDFLEKLDNRRGGTDQIELAGNVSGAVDEVAILHGTVGQFRFWEYVQTYETDSNQTEHFWPEFGVGLVGSGRFNGHMAYGAIQDTKALTAQSRFAKDYYDEEIGTDILLTQCAPLSVPVDADASLFALVR